MTPSGICVYCGSAAGADPAYAHAAGELAGELAAREIRVIYGGGSVGLMGVVADAALAAGGEVVGVIPRFLREREVGHDGLTELRVVETMHERKMLMADLADGFVVAPGGIGTLEEVVEMLSWSQLGLHRKPIGLLNAAGFWDPLTALLDHMAAQRFVGADHRRLLMTGERPAELLDAMAAWEPPAGARWLRRVEET